jgi:hypothetical protein
MPRNPPKPSAFNPINRPTTRGANKQTQTNKHKHTSRYGPVGPNHGNRRFRRKRYHRAALQQRSVSHCTQCRLGLPPARLREAWARPAHVCAGTLPTGLRSGNTRKLITSAILCTVRSAVADQAIYCPPPAAAVGARFVRGDSLRYRRMRGVAEKRRGASHSRPVRRRTWRSTSR